MDISSRRITYFHENKLGTSSPALSKWGKHTKRKISQLTRQSVLDHINLFPRVESHYCRQNTCKEYFEGNLNLKKIHEMYVVYCTEKEITPAKESMYRYIFNHEFNIEFQKPKKDLCDTCYEYRNTVNPNEEQSYLFNEHVTSKKETKIERDKDRQLIEPNTSIVCIDLENVLSLPKSNVGNFFYKRKLSCYNLTGHCSLNKKAYCILWHEGMAGCSGNDIASASYVHARQNYQRPA